MKQVTQRLRNGRIELVDVPWPDLDPNGVIVDIRASVLSVGTEKAKVATARSSLVQKARKRPDDVKKVLDKAKSEGITRTVRAVKARLDEPSPLGYSSAGVVVAVGENVRGVAPGDRVACGGDAIAVHAEVAQIPGNLCVPIPGDLPFEQAAFATVGSIAMQGVRQADVRLGERVAVIGLGLVGQLAGQILRASGCIVTGIDLDPQLVSEAVENGSVDQAFGRSSLDGTLPAELDGVDVVLIAAATPSPDPANFAATLCRDRGRVVIVGDVRLDIQREPYYRKELDLRLSRSYGPGRYDVDYEDRGLDYPIGYVRWTERRNMGEVLRLAEAGLIPLEKLISRTVPVEQAEQVFDELMEAERSPLGIALVYGETPKPPAQPFTRSATTASADRFAVGLIGAGNFATQIVAPGLKSAGFKVGVAMATPAEAAAHQHIVELHLVPRNAKRVRRRIERRGLALRAAPHLGRLPVGRDGSDRVQRLHLGVIGKIAAVLGLFARRSLRRAGEAIRRGHPPHRAPRRRREGRGALRRCDGSLRR